MLKTELTAYVEIGGGAVMSIPNPQSYADGGLSWRLSYGNPESVRHVASSIIQNYDHLLSSDINMTEAVRRLRLLRAARRDLVKNTPPQ